MCVRSGLRRSRSSTAIWVPATSILNLRYPTVGESSGTLLRALGMGKAVIVSDVGSFREYPDEICLKAPVDASEEDHLFEYMNLLVSRPEMAQALGARARRGWSESAIGIWSREQYAYFLARKRRCPRTRAVEPTAPVAVPIEYIAELDATG